MKNKKILILFSVFIIILSLNALSATSNISEETTLDIHKINDQTENNIVKQASSNDVYVNIDSKNDIEDGSKENPYKTINNENIEKIASDSTIHVSKGTYQLNSTNLNKNLSIIGENQEEVIFTPITHQSAFTIPQGANLLLKNFTLKDYTSPTQAAITNDGNLIIENLNLLNNIGTTTNNNGGSILNNGNLTIINSTLNENMASFGAAVYSNANLTVYNSSFIDNSIYNVGGAIYNAKGNLSVYDSYFESNIAVSGAAIYSAFGNLYVNNTTFFNNKAQHFFGGAIYSTGFATTENCLFDANFANKDGGAITNTNNFTIKNCTFIENAANENGGAIENVPWTDVENGNLTILNSIFIGNSASDKGGVFINYGKIEAQGEPATITVRNSIFELNSASTAGIIYNEQYIDFENNVFIDNEAYGDKLISSETNWIKSINANWWGTNNPSEQEIGVKPETWIVMNFTNTTSLITGKTANLQVSLNTLNNGQTINSEIPIREVSFTADNSSFAENIMIINQTVNNTVNSEGDTIYAQIDNQKLSLKPTEFTKTDTIITINKIPEVRFNDYVPITGTFKDINGNPLFNTNVAVIVNGKGYSTKTDKEGVFQVVVVANKIGENKVTATYNGNNYYNGNTTNTSFNAAKQDLIFFLDDVDNVSWGEDVTVSGVLSDIQGNVVYNTKVVVYLNGVPNVVKTDINGGFTVKTKSSEMGGNTVNVLYGGNDYFNPMNISTKFNILKQDVKLVVYEINNVSFNDEMRIKGILTDADSNALYSTNIVVNINGRNMYTKTDANGTFVLKTNASNIGDNIVTVSFLGNGYFNAQNVTTSFNVKKQDLNITFTQPIIKTNCVKIYGSVKDMNGYPIYDTNIVFTVNNKSFNQKTDEWGLFMFYADTVEGINSISAAYGGNNYYNGKSTSISFNI